MHRLTASAAAAFVLSVLAPLAASRAQDAGAPSAPDNIGHTRHHHHHNEKHPTEAPTPGRFVTTRNSSIVLPLTDEKDSFTFVVFGDRTGGPDGGVSVLADAVRDTNLIEPDLVITVGDLIQGYNTTPDWTRQMREYKAVMDELRCPWYPVSGNHDVYWRGEGKPENEHETNYEANFGPLWYAFEHKNCWFIALHSDEGNPETGEKNFNKPECQKMSEAQFSFLKDTLAKAKDAEHVFLFLHHPRWLGNNYGDDWNKVHDALKAAGNVTAVFAGHIHRMRSDPKDGIEYITLATVGGHQNATVPDAGWLHHFNLITVRKQQVAYASIPVGEVMDVREITGAMADECARLTESAPRISGPLALSSDGSATGTVTVTLHNPTTRDVEITVMPESADSRWVFTPDHDHGRMAPGAKMELAFRVSRGGGTLDAFLRMPEVLVQSEYLMPGRRYAIPDRRAVIPLDASALPGPEQAPSADTAVEFDGRSALLVPSELLPVADGPFTLECWVRPEDFARRTGLLAKTEGSEFGLLLSDGRPEFSVFLGSSYATISTDKRLRRGAWQHLAGVFDGAEVRLYVDGSLVQRAPASGARKLSTLPMMIGADVTDTGGADAFFKGRIDGVRLSAGAAYSGASFKPERRASAPGSAIVVMNFDALTAGAPWADKPGKYLGYSVGMPRLVPAE